MDSKRWWLVAALAWVAVLRPVDASTFIAMGTAELVSASSAIVEGEVLRVDSYWDDEGRVILSEAMVLVRDTVAGEAHSIVRVKTFGGTVDGFTVEAIGFPRFVKGERVFLFLEPDRQADMMRVAGYQQGQYRIVAGVDGVERAVSAVDEGAELVPSAKSAVTLPQTLPLAELKELVRREAARLEQAVSR